jgi:ATP-binding cassette subfamily B protein
MKFPHYTQLDAMDCGSTCLRMLAKYYGRSYSSQTLTHIAAFPSIFVKI